MHQRKIPAPGFLVEVVMIDYDGSQPERTKANPSIKGSSGSTGNVPTSDAKLASNSSKNEVPTNGDDDVFSDSEGEETQDSETRKAKAASEPRFGEVHQASDVNTHNVEALTRGTNQLTLHKDEHTKHNASEESSNPNIQKSPKAVKGEYADASDIKAIAADASVFSFGDEDFDSD